MKKKKPVTRAGFLERNPLDDAGIVLGEASPPPASAADMHTGVRGALDLSKGTKGLLAATDFPLKDDLSKVAPLLVSLESSLGRCRHLHRPDVIELMEGFFGR